MAAPTQNRLLRSLAEGAPHNQRLKQTEAAILVFRVSTSFQAASAA
jgi:hypothetical protein